MQLGTGSKSISLQSPPIGDLTFPFNRHKIRQIPNNYVTPFSQHPGSQFL